MLFIVETVFNQMFNSKVKLKFTSAILTHINTYALKIDYVVSVNTAAIPEDFFCAEKELMILYFLNTDQGLYTCPSYILSL